MTAWCRADVSLPFPTNRPHHTKTTKRLTCADAYQSLPESLLAARNPEVILVWSTNAYHVADLALLLPSVAFTNHYRREEDITHSTMTMCYVMLCTVIDCG